LLFGTACDMGRVEQADASVGSRELFARTALA